MSDGKRTPQILELVEQFSELLYRYAYRLTGNRADAEDLTQQTFLRAQEKIHQLREVSTVKWWLCSIVRNSFLTSRRHAGVVQSLDAMNAVGRLDDSLCLREAPEAVIDSEELQRALLELSEEFRSPLILYYFEEFSYQEIAEQMGLPMGTVMSRLSRAKAFLRRRLSEESNAELPRDRVKVAT